MKSFISSILQLQNIIEGELPGEEVQYKMAPLSRGKMIDFKSKIISARHGAVCINLFEHNESIHTLLTVRQENLNTHAGQVSFPGGKIESFDKSEYEAAIREFEEETGISSSKLNLIGGLSPLYIPASNYLVKPFVTFSSEVFTVKPDSNEVQELIYLDISELLNDSLKSEVKVKLFTGITTYVPCYIIQSKAVWGATAMILSELEEIVKKAFRHN